MVTADGLVTLVLVCGDNIGISPLLRVYVFISPDLGDVLVYHSSTEIASMLKQLCRDIVSARRLVLQ